MSRSGGNQWDGPTVVQVMRDQALIARDEAREELEELNRHARANYDSTGQPRTQEAQEWSRASARALHNVYDPAPPAVVGHSGNAGGEYMPRPITQDSPFRGLAWVLAAQTVVLAVIALLLALLVL